MAEDVKTSDSSNRQYFASVAGEKKKKQNHFDFLDDQNCVNFSLSFLFSFKMKPI